MRDGQIDSLRTWCNLMIVLVHVYPFMYASSHGVEFWVSSFFSMNLALMAMPVLFFISGYLMFVNYESKGFLDKMKSRFWRLLVPLVVWNLIAILLYNLMAFSVSSASDFVERMGLNSVDGICMQFNPVSKLADSPLWCI